jgi:hypothetical protein
MFRQLRVRSRLGDLSLTFPPSGTLIKNIKLKRTTAHSLAIC